MKELILANIVDHSLSIPHIGITLRVLLSAANDADPTHRQWRILYKDVCIGSIKIKTNQETKEIK
jgi:hypothetical protein